MALIKDNGKIRNCPNNKAKMSYWQILREFHGYRGYWAQIVDSLQEVGEAVMLVLSFIMWIITFPILPLLGTFFDQRRAIKEVEKENKENS
jgi:hypothetical protein